MDARGWTLVDLAARSGVSKSAISNVRNYRDPSDKHATVQTVDALATAFGMQAWELLRPDTFAASGVAEPEPLDTALLATSIRECIGVFHDVGVLPTFDELAAATVQMYTNVQTGIPLRRAAAQVSHDLDQIRRGTKLATLQASLGEDSTHGQGHPRARRRGKARTD